MYGDAGGALRSTTLLDAETGTLRWRDLRQVVEARPDRRKLLDGGARLFALAQAHAVKLPDASGNGAASRLAGEHPAG